MNIMETMMIWRYECNLMLCCGCIGCSDSLTVHFSHLFLQQVHFRSDHFLCEDETCLAKKFIVFQIEAELKVKYLFFIPTGCYGDTQ